MFKIICKIWQFLVKIFKTVLSAVLEVLGAVITAILQLGSEIWGAVFGENGFGFKSILTVGLLGLGAWWLIGAVNERKDEQEFQEVRRASLQQ